MVPLVDPDVNATETFRLEDWAEETWPVTLKVVPVEAIAGKQDDAELLTAITVPVSAFPFWLKLTVRLVLPEGAAGAKMTLQFPVTAGV
jgi:hypothetical protein